MMPVPRRPSIVQCILVIAACALPIADLPAQELPKQPADVERFLKGIYAEENQQYTFRADYPGGFQRWQSDARPVLRRLVGLDKIAEQVGGHKPIVELNSAEDKGDYTIWKGQIETEPNVRFPFWLLRPKGDGPFPFAVLPHGHDRRGHDTYAGVYHDEAHREQSLAQDRDVAVQAVKRGFVAIAPAVRGLATAANGVPDVFDRHGSRDCRSHFMHCILAGRTAIGERVWDMSRLIDWAATLPDVDTKNILMMGNSGGGVVTMYAAACDERITIAVPSCSFSVIASREGRIYHCDCCAIPGILGWGELYDVCGLVAPRHLLAVNGVKDTLHTDTDINRSAERVRAIFKAAGVPDHFEHRWGPEGHRFYSNLMWPFVMKAMTPLGTDQDQNK